MNLPSIHQFDRLALDTETTGLQYKRAKVFGVSISTPDGKDYYWDTRNERILDWMRDELTKYKGLIIYANASFDIRMLENSGVNLLECNFDDVITRASCIDEHLMSYSLDSLSKKYLNAGKHTELYTDLAAIFGGRATKNVQMKNISQAPVDVVAPYAKKDTRLTLELYDWQEGEIARQEIEEITTFERDLMPMFIGMEMHGIRVDESYTEEAISGLEPIISEHQTQIDRLFDTEVNVNSSPQVKGLFTPTQDKLGDWYASDGTLLENTKTGNASLGADALRIMKHPGAMMILEQRSLIKTRDTFLKGHVLGSAVGGRVYPTINQSKAESGGTGTGRLSIQTPAMQQIPSRNKKVAALVKPCFLPNEGHVWLDADMASFEVRVFAHLAGVTQAYANDPHMDFHQWVADLTGLVRNAEYSGQPNAKQLNLSMIFNSGKGAIADTMGMDWTWDQFTDRTGKLVRYKRAGKEAQAVIDTYHKKLPGVARLAEGCKNKAEQRGYIFTKYGRHLRFPRKWKTYKASGLLIQATAADINKENLKLITEVLTPMGGNLLLNTHDSYSMSIPESTWWKDAFEEVRHAVERPVLDVPLILDLNGHGRNWADALGLNK